MSREIKRVFRFYAKKGCHIVRQTFNLIALCVLTLNYSATDLSAVVKGKTQPAEGLFLVARPEFPGRYFNRSVILLVHYGRSGAVGLIINRPSDIPLSKLIPDVKAFQDRDDLLFIGGPVMPKLPFLLIKADKAPRETKKVLGNVYFSSDMTVIKELADKKGGIDDIRVFAGYAGWAPGQLEAEIYRGSWLLVKSSPSIIFDKRPDKLWDYLINREKLRSEGVIALLRPSSLDSTDTHR